MKVIWDNAPAHRREAMREYLRTPGLGLQLLNLPGYSPDFNADEAIWGWAREEATGNLCLGSKAAVPDSPAIQSGSVFEELLSRQQMPGKCTSLLGFGLGKLPAPFRLVLSSAGL